MRIAMAFLGLFLASCATTPKHGALLASYVTVGINRMEAETEAMITALGDVERAVLNDAWEQLYRSAESKYRAQNGLPAAAALGEEQRIDVATIAAKAREDALGAIAAKEQALKASVQVNARRVVELNQVVESYLMSLEELQAAKERAAKLIGEITGVDVSVLVNEGKRSLAKLQ